MKKVKHFRSNQSYFLEAQKEENMMYYVVKHMYKRYLSYFVYLSFFCFRVCFGILEKLLNSVGSEFCGNS